MGTRTTLLISFLPPNDILDLLKTLHNFDACPPISIFPRFNQPGIPLFGFKPILELLIFLLLFVLSNRLSPSLIFFLELGELLIIDIGDMEGHGNVLERVDLLGIVVIFEVHEESLFV